MNWEGIKELPASEFVAYDKDKNKVIVKYDDLMTE